MTAIVCVDKNWAIGRENRLLFRISADLKYFRALTTGKTVVMGKNTLLSLPGGRPLPDRRNLVVSTTMAPREGVEIARSIEEAAALAGEDAVLMGGAQLYRALLPRCERVLVTQVDAAAEGADAFFPNLDAAPDWTVETAGEWQEENGLRFRYVDYVRRTEGNRGFPQERKALFKCGENEYNEERFSERRRGPWRS